MTRSIASKRRRRRMRGKLRAAIRAGIASGPAEPWDVAELKAAARADEFADAMIKRRVGG